MISAQIIRIWKKLLPLFFVFVLVHFLKDLTQDIFKIATPLDLLGDAKEDLSQLPPSIQKMYMFGLGGLSIAAEVFLLVTIPKVWKITEFTKLDKSILVIFFLLILFFITAIILDPRYNIF